MADAHWLFIVVMALHIASSSQQLSVSPKVGCVSAAQAESISEEIVKLFSSAPLVESSTNLFSSITTLSLIESCAGTHSGSFDFENKFRTKAQELLARATQAEEKIDGGNKCKQQQQDLADKILVMWEKIKLTTKHHRKLLRALDIFILDSVLQKAAEIELDIKKGSTQWTVDKVHDDLKNEMTKVETVMSTMSTSIRYTMDYVVKAIIQYYTSSKIYTALRETSLYEDIHSNLMVDMAWGYSDVAIAKFTRNTVNMKYGTMITGVSEAIDYVNKVNNTLNEIEEVVESLSKISETTSCSERDRIGNDAFTSLEDIYNNMQNNIRAASTYQETMQNYGSEQMMPLLTDRALVSGLAGMYFTIPEFGKRTEKQSEAFREVGGYAVNIRQLENVPEASRFVERAFPFLDVLSRSSRCYFKIFNVIGNIIQGCSDGKGSFDDLHHEVTTAAKLNRRKCYEITGLRIPSKSEIEGIVGRAASKLGFNSDCTQNEQPDEDEGNTSFSFYDDSDEEEKKELSPTQRKMVCDLRKTSKPKSRIAELIKVDETKVQAVRCKA